MQSEPPEEWVIEHTLRIYRSSPVGLPAVAVDCWSHDCPNCREPVLLWRDWTGVLRTQRHEPGCPYAGHPDQLARAWRIR